MPAIQYGNILNWREKRFVKRQPNPYCYRAEVDRVVRVPGKRPWLVRPKKDYRFVGVRTTVVQPSLEDQFHTLARQWWSETAFQSSLPAIVMNRAYQRIIGMGRPVLPLILRELRTRPDHWFWALNSISGVDAAEGIKDVNEAAKAWLAWGARENLV